MTDLEHFSTISQARDIIRQWIFNLAPKRNEMPRSPELRNVTHIRTYVASSSTTEKMRWHSSWKTSYWKLTVSIYQLLSYLTDKHFELVCSFSISSCDCKSRLTLFWHLLRTGLNRLDIMLYGLYFRSLKKYGHICIRWVGE